MKKTLTAILVSALALTTTACGGDDPRGPAPGSSSLVDAYTAWIAAEQPVLQAITDALAPEDQLSGQSIDLLELASVLSFQEAFAAVALFTGDYTEARFEPMFPGAAVSYSISGYAYHLNWTSTTDASGGEIICMWRRDHKPTECTHKSRDETGTAYPIRVLEFVPTDYGHVAQYRVDSVDGSAFARLTTDGHDGVLGWSFIDSMNPYGSIDAYTDMNSPKQFTSWYQVTGDRFTGVLQNGDFAEFDFTRSP